MVAEAEDGLLFSTIQVYTPAVVTVRVCVYCAVSGSSNTVSVPSVTMVESLVQVTVVAGPPVEIQERASWSESNVTPPGILMSIICIIIYTLATSQSSELIYNITFVKEAIISSCTNTVLCMPAML